jgi:hypothetical protein
VCIPTRRSSSKISWSRKNIGLLGKLAFHIFEVFYDEPMLVINPALYAPQPNMQMN